MWHALQITIRLNALFVDHFAVCSETNGQLIAKLANKYKWSMSSSKFDGFFYCRKKKFHLRITIQFSDQLNSFYINFCELSSWLTHEFQQIKINSEVKWWKPLKNTLENCIETLSFHPQKRSIQKMIAVAYSVICLMQSLFVKYQNVFIN